MSLNFWRVGREKGGKGIPHEEELESLSVFSSSSSFSINRFPHSKSWRKKTSRITQKNKLIKFHLKKSTYK